MRRRKTSPPSQPWSRSYLDVELQVSLVHLSGHHALDHMHRHQLVALVGRAEDVVCVALLNLHIEEPTHRKNKES